MSSNRFKNSKSRFEELMKKELTPKNYRPTHKVSPMNSSLGGDLTLKSYLNSKPKGVRPSTSKHFSDRQNFFQSIKDDKKNNYSSVKKFKKQEPISKPLDANPSHSQPRPKSKSPLKQPDKIVKEEIEVRYPQTVALNRQIRHYQNQHPQLPRVIPPIPNSEKAKHSLKSNGLIKAYAASTNQGPVRNYNEDRVAIILNIAKPEHCVEWKKAAYFGVFDGHGGVDCADFLRDNLHLFVSKQKSFPNDMQLSLKVGFEKCENKFVEHSRALKTDKSGSCAIVTFFYGDHCFVANVGDSRAIMSSNYGQKISELSIDHKASDQFEQKRIYDAGGRIYQTKLKNSIPGVKIYYEGEEHDFVLGPHRVMPGRLSVTRTFGDIEAKLVELQGNPRGIINEPEVRSIKITPEMDFIVLASDGVFDKMSNEEMVEIVWDTFRREAGNFKTLHQFCGLAVQYIMKLAFHKKTLDNITVVIVALEGLQKYISQRQIVNERQSPLNRTLCPENKQPKINTKYEASFQRRYVGRSTSPSNYLSLRSHSFYRN